MNSTEGPSGRDRFDTTFRVLTLTAIAFGTLLVAGLAFALSPVAESADAQVAAIAGGFLLLLGYGLAVDRVLRSGTTGGSPGDPEDGDNVQWW